jgi:iron complex transport system ATP-binding protein
MLSIHDLNLARRFATHVMLFRGNGHVDAGATDDVMRDDALTTAFGHPVSRVTVGQRALFVAE